MMLSLEECQQLMVDFIKLRKNYQESDTSENKNAFLKQEKLCIEKFSYIVKMRTARYRSFSNYDDLNQEGMEALLKAMKNFNPSKNSNFFYWAHRYVDTRIARKANLHTAIRYPLKVAKITPPRKESTFPVDFDEEGPDSILEELERAQLVRNSLSSLTEEEQKAITLFYGLDGDKPKSINKICKILGISRISCIKTIDNALSELKENLKF